MPEGENEVTSCTQTLVPGGAASLPIVCGVLDASSRENVVTSFSDNPLCALRLVGSGAAEPS